MTGANSKHLKCDVCGHSFPSRQLTSAELISDYLAKLIRKDVPSWSDTSHICPDDLHHYRSLYVQKAIEGHMGELSRLENAVIRSLKNQELLSANVNRQFDESLTFGDRLADRIAEFGGSWRFIISFTLAAAAWIFFNLQFWNEKPFDPFPFILLNLFLSCIAALQAPFIMMSQNRQDSKDRLRSEMDYKINLKAELEIRHLKAELDHLASRQWHRLLAIQQLQTDLIEELVRGKEMRAPKES